MPTTYTPTALERHAAEAAAEAADYLHRAQSLLDVAENALLEEERKHAPAISPGNQRKCGDYAEVSAALDDLRARLAALVSPSSQEEARYSRAC